MIATAVDWHALWQAVMTALATFFVDWRTIAIVSLIALDVITGVMRALRTHTYQWSRLADFLGTMVLPLVLGYLVVYIFGAVLGTAMPPAVRDIIQAVDQWAGAGAAILALTASIGDNLTAFGGAGTPAAQPRAFRDLWLGRKRDTLEAQAGARDVNTTPAPPTLGSGLRKAGWWRLHGYYQVDLGDRAERIVVESQPEYWGADVIAAATSPRLIPPGWYWTQVLPPTTPQTDPTPAADGA